MSLMDYGPDWPPAPKPVAQARPRRRRIGWGVWLVLAFNLGVLAVVAGLAVQAERPIPFEVTFHSPSAASAPHVAGTPHRPHRRHP
jgi:hypothetical protein